MACRMHFAYSDTRHPPRGAHAQVAELVLHRDVGLQPFVSFTNEKGFKKEPHGNWGEVRDHFGNITGLEMSFSCHGGKMRHTRWVRIEPFAFQCLTIPSVTMRVSKITRSDPQLSDDDDDDNRSELSFVIV